MTDPFLTRAQLTPLDRSIAWQGGALCPGEKRCLEDTIPGVSAGVPLSLWVEGAMSTTYFPVTFRPVVCILNFVA